ncbi:MAG: type II toxin-antitoxin system RelE/ParE family toxin [Thermoplasmata archaeon]|nr:type II toxin-antitoxin system RelE/ParE family toxin [Thermoplasmata archaeon]
MTKRVILSPRAQKEYNKLPRDVRKRVKKSLKILADGSQRSDIKKLKGVGGREDLFRLRVGDYRITYFPEPDVINVIRIDHRGKGFGWLD